MRRFKLKSAFKPRGDQPRAIKQLRENLNHGEKYQTLLGVTGSGKTYTMACVIAALNRPALVISHNKTLAAQLYAEFKNFFPENAVEYFISYYDYYQPEAYIPQTDTYIEKDSAINDRIDRLRLSATCSLLSREDVIIVASVSCIYSLGSPQEYCEMLLELKKGRAQPMDAVLGKLVEMRYERNDIEFSRGKFRVKGDTLEIFPGYWEKAIRVEFFGNEIEQISVIDPLTGNPFSREPDVIIYPASHFVANPETLAQAAVSIRQELEQELEKLNRGNKLLEAQRLKIRTEYDLEMMAETGYCHGIENYSRHLSSRRPGERPYCLLDYFPKDFLTIIDESHVTIPQVRGMYNGDRSRKEVLVRYGFRLPSCLDNRPLKFPEFEQMLGQVVFVSATPADYELNKSKHIIEQLIRPTGLIDPAIAVRPTKNQIDDLIAEVRQRAEQNQRVLVTTLTKRMAEDLTQYLKELHLRVEYLHSDIETLERVKILQQLRKGEFDCLVGINLLREGLDLPEVSLVCILDADKEGFLRSQTSLIQVAGRAARHIDGKVIMYADHVTGSMEKAIAEMERRRETQIDYNRAHHITPRGITKAIHDLKELEQEAVKKIAGIVAESMEEYVTLTAISEMEEQMSLAARNLQFEQAAKLRDQIAILKKK